MGVPICEESHVRLKKARYETKGLVVSSSLHAGTVFDETKEKIALKNYKLEDKGRDLK